MRMRIHVRTYVARGLCVRVRMYVHVRTDIMRNATHTARTINANYDASRSLRQQGQKIVSLSES